MELFSIRRTDKNFSRSAIDITLEQTTNADAASRNTGIADEGICDIVWRPYWISRWPPSEF